MIRLCILAFSVLFAACGPINGQPTTVNDGIEQCQSADGQVRTVAHRSVSTHWTIYYDGKTYDLDINSLVSGARSDVTFSDEHVSHFQCDGANFVERDSTRQITIRDDFSYQVIYSGKVFCKSTAPTTTEDEYLCH